MFLVSIAMLVILPFIIFGYNADTRTQTWVLSIALCLPAFLIGYLVSRWRYGETSLLISISLSIVAVVLPPLLLDASQSLESFFYLIAGTVISALVLSLRSTLFLFALSLFALFFGAPYMRGLDAETVVLGPGVFNLMMGALIITAIYLLRAESGRQRRSLGDSERRYRMISEMISDYAYLIRLEPDGRMRREWITEESYHRITGLDVAGLDRMLAENSWLNEYPAELRASVDSAMQRAVRGEANEQEMYFITKEHERRWLHIARQPVRDENGTITHVLGVAQDITARKEAEMRLLESEERYRTLSELMSDYAFFIRVEGAEMKLEWMTDSFERLTGYHADEVFPSGTAKLFHPDDLPRLVDDIVHVLQGKETVSELRITTKGGEPKTLIYRRRPVWNEDRTAVTGYYSVVEDVTERKLTEARERKLHVEEQQLRMVRQFVLAISHDFRTLLANIETSRYLVERLLPSEVFEAAQPKLQRIHHAVEHISKQLDNLQLISSLAHLHLMPININELLEEVCARHSAMAAQQGIDLFCTASPESQSVALDQDKMTTALNHLVRNALANTPEGGRIGLRAALEEDWLVLQVEDTGQGIASADLPHIFEAFYRSDAARQVDRGGLGLGLTLVKMIVDGHGGEVNVRSEVGLGSCFKLRLPLEKAP